MKEPLVAAIKVLLLGDIMNGSFVTPHEKPLNAIERGTRLIPYPYLFPIHAYICPSPIGILHSWSTKGVAGLP